MPKKPPSDRTRAAGVPPNPRHRRERPPTTQKCETNPIPAYPVSRCPLFLRNEPNWPHHHHPPTQKYETNPISGQPDERLKTGDWRLKTAFKKRTQFTPTPPSRRPLFLQNEPNSSTPSVSLPPISAKRTQLPPPSCLVPIAYCLYFAKRTQLPPAPHRLFDFLLSRGQQPAPLLPIVGKYA